MFNILFIGDISGRMGREAVKKLLPRIKKEHRPDMVIANIENAAHGSGFTETILKEMTEAGINCFTNGDHAFDREKQIDVCFEKFPIVRPANYPIKAKGRGYIIIEHKEYSVLVINLIGRVFMQMDYDCPFRKLDEILANKDLPIKTLSAIIVDIHAEATSEKIALSHYANGRISALLGTHTHVMTADSRILDKGMAYITDVGMTGSNDGVIGVSKESIIDTFLTQIKHSHSIPEKGEAILNAVLVKINPKTRSAVSIKPIVEYLSIK